MYGLRWAIRDKEVIHSITKLEMLVGPDGLATFLGATVGPYLRQRAQERFQSEGDDVTGPWLPLDPTTVAIRDATGFGGEHPINRRTGELEDWVTQGDTFGYPIGSGATLLFPSNEPTGRLRTKVETAQKGKKSPATPPRPVIGVNEKDLLFITAALAAAIQGASK
jgi:hypothetical protein